MAASLAFGVMASDRSASPVPGSRFAAADITNHLHALQRKTPKGFTVVVQPPFMVIGPSPKS